MKLWKFGGDELKIHLLELFNKIIDKKSNAKRMGDRNGDKQHKKGQKVNVKIIKELLYCLQLTNYFANIIKNRLN